MPYDFPLLNLSLIILQVLKARMQRVYELGRQMTLWVGNTEVPLYKAGKGGTEIVHRLILYVSAY